MATNLQRRASCVILCTTMALANGCASSRAAAPQRPARINHVVLFKLHDPSDAGELIVDCDTKLGAVPGVRSYFAGPPIDTGRGERVAGDYHVGFYVGFDSPADYLAYVDHPNHVAVVQKWRLRLQWLRAFDVIDDSP